MIASLHQGIADVAPTRLPFYENWLTPPGMREAKFGLAPLHAVLSFLRREGQPSYDLIMRRAGAYSAEWGYAQLPSVTRAIVHRLPLALRTRAALYLSRRLVTNTFRGSRPTTRLRKGIATMDIRGSVFCAGREAAGWPTCVFYLAALERFLRRFELDASVDVSQCKASGGRECTLTVTIRGQRLEHATAEAA